MRRFGCRHCNWCRSGNRWVTGCSRRGDDNGLLRRQRGEYGWRGRRHSRFGWRRFSVIRVGGIVGVCRVVDIISRVVSVIIGWRGAGPAGLADDALGGEAVPRVHVRFVIGGEAAAGDMGEAERARARAHEHAAGFEQFVDEAGNGARRQGPRHAVRDSRPAASICRRTGPAPRRRAARTARSRPLRRASGPACAGRRRKRPRRRRARRRRRLPAGRRRPGSRHGGACRRRRGKAWSRRRDRRGR